MNLRQIAIILVFAGLFGQLSSQTVQWGFNVYGFSSEYSDKQYAASQILGIPNVLPVFRDSPCAWSPASAESRVDEWIHVGFKSPMQVRQVAIAESFNPGAISRIYLYDASKVEYLVYKNDAPVPLPEQGRMFRVFIDKTPYKVKSIKIVLNTIGMPGFNHIDAVAISDGDAPIEAEINTIKNVNFESKPENLGMAVNSKYDEIMPIISPDGKTLFFDRKDHPENTGGIINDDIWMSTMGSTGNWTRAENVGGPFNNKGHNFLTAISPDGNTALLGNVYEQDGSMSSGLSISHRNENGWEFPQKLKIRNYYNNNKYSEFHLGADGKTIIMTVQRGDTYGGKDMYVCFLEPDGQWSIPKNLGGTVNSASTEMSPFLAADGKTLYFSSDGFSGYGGKDMFMTRRLDNTWTNWTTPQNLGPKINSANWDAYYSIPASGEFAYFSSESNSYGKTDIFRIKLPEEMRPEPVVLVRGVVKDEKTGKPIMAKISYETLSDGKEAGVAMTNPRTGEYTIILPAGEKYSFHASAENYLSENENLDLRSIQKYEEIKKNLRLVPIQKGESIVLNNVFFKPSSSELTDDSGPELKRIYNFLELHKNLVIEIGGHTNNACTEEYCIKLSTERAKSVYDYLIMLGLDPKRISYKGYGSSHPRYDNDTPDGLKANRRVEFTITGT